MNEPIKYEEAVAQMLLENKHWIDEMDDIIANEKREKAKQDEAEWQAEMRAHKIEQMHDFLEEKYNQENEEE